MYSVYSYGQMLADTPRMQAYVAALRRTVKPGMVVLDLGCGPGVFALLACQSGARRVYAIESDDVIQLAREAATANGYGERIEFFQGFSTDIALPEVADVVVSDLRGVLPWYQRHIPSVIDARTRLLASGGKLIPHRDVLWAAVVEASEEYSELVTPWVRTDFDLSAAKRTATNTWRKAHIAREQLLTRAICLCKLDYTTVESPDFKSELVWRAERSGTAHGFAVWFDSELIDDIGFSNAPGEPELIYGQGFFPFPHAVELAQGDRINVTLSANVVRDDYVWRWNTKIFTADAPETKVCFQQSTMYGVALSPTTLRKHAATHRPTLNDDGQIKTFILNSFTSENSLEEIAKKLAEQFPQRYSEWTAALDDVTAASLEYSK